MAVADRANRVKRLVERPPRRLVDGLDVGVRAVLVLALLVSGTGFVVNPVWAIKRVQQAMGERYPCESGLCACSSAERCWTSWGCQTIEQKIAWAEHEGVAVPGSARARLALAARARGEAPACALCATGEPGAEAPGPEPGRPGVPIARGVGCGDGSIFLAFPSVLVMPGSPEAQRPMLRSPAALLGCGASVWRADRPSVPPPRGASA
ncbi:MAG: hypothetical protein AAFP26_11595 [Planctomycetota bacterium]